MFNILTKRSVISSQAELEFAQTSTQLFDERTISTIAATIVRVFPVPFEQRKYLLIKSNILVNYHVNFIYQLSSQLSSQLYI